MARKQITDSRHKTDLRIPQELFGMIEATAKDTLGVPINAFMSMAAAHYIALVHELYPGKKRREIFKALQREFQKLIDRANEQQ